MALDLFKEKGTPLDRQTFTWRDMVRPPISKFNDDAFTRTRVILMNGIETEASRFSHACARMNRDLQLALARVRRIERPSSEGNGVAIAALRAGYIRDAEPVGAMPQPPTPKGVASTAVGVLEGTRPAVLLDKLGERLAFERTGTRLYEALITKCESSTAGDPTPPLEELRQIHDDELSHFEILRDAIVGLGADPTVQTPCADVPGVASMGLLQVVSDPRTTPTQCLEAILIAELADNDAWAMLVRLAETSGHTAMAAQFRTAAASEAKHLVRVRAWLETAINRDAGTALDASKRA